MKCLAFVQRSLIYRMYIKTENHFYVINAGFTMIRHSMIYLDMCSFLHFIVNVVYCEIPVDNRNQDYWFLCVFIKQCMYIATGKTILKL